MSNSCTQSTAQTNAKKSNSEKTKKSKEYLVCNYQFLLKKIEIVKRNSFYIPFYTVTNLHGEQERIMGGCLLPNDVTELDDFGIRSERSFVQAIAICAHSSNDSCKAELERHRKLGREIEEINLSDVYVGVDEWETEEGRKWCISGSNYIIGHNQGNLTIKCDGFMWENPRYSLFNVEKL